MRLDLIRKEAVRNKEIPRYDNRCRHLTDAEVADKLAAKQPFTVRLRLAHGPVAFHDLVAGPMSIDLSKVESDPILLKSDDLPTYHLANVVDDHLMGITHVLRGSEWLQATPKHLMLFQALGLQPPAYGHLPLILNADGSKLSKRALNMRLDSFREQGYFPETLVNYMARMGGAVDVTVADETLYSLSELTDMFSLERMASHANRYDFNVMMSMNRQCLKQQLACDVVSVRKAVRKLMAEKLGKDDLEIDEERLDFVLHWSQVSQVNP